jgi:hypothetical protein
LLGKKRNIISNGAVADDDLFMGIEKPLHT